MVVALYVEQTSNVAFWRFSVIRSRVRMEGKRLRSDAPISVQFPPTAFEFAVRSNKFPCFLSLGISLHLTDFAARFRVQSRASTPMKGLFPVNSLLIRDSKRSVGQNLLSERISIRSRVSA